MKDKIITFIKKRKLYEYLKYSRLFYAYEWICKPAVRKNFEKELFFYQSFLPKSSLIFDIGAFDGHKTVAFLQLAEKVVCCEPDLKNFATLKIRFRNQKTRVLLENIAVAEINGEKEMFIHHPGSAFNTLNPKFKNLGESKGPEKWNEEIRFDEKRSVPVFTLDSLIKKYGLPNFIKIDAEGSELAIIKGLSHRVSFLSLEFNFPEFKEEFDEVVNILEDKFYPGLLYNIAIDEILILPAFVTKDILLDFVSSHAYPYFELIVKMKMQGDGIN